MKIQEPLVTSLEERAVSWVSLAGSPGVQRYLHQGCVAAEPSGQTQRTAQCPCRSDVERPFHLSESRGLVVRVRSRCFPQFRCKPAIPARGLPEADGRRHLETGFLDVFWCILQQVTGISDY